MQLLLAAGAAPAFHLIERSTTTTSWTALCKASQLGHARRAKILIAAGANVSSQTHSGFGPLAEASLNNRPEIMELLLDSGAYVHPRDHRDRTPLLLACMSDGGAPECVRLLLERGARVEARNEDGWTPLMEACSRGHGEVVSLLLGAGADLRKIIATRKVSYEYEGWTALMFAAARDHDEAVRVMVSAGAEWDTRV